MTASSREWRAHNFAPVSEISFNSLVNLFDQKSCPCLTLFTVRWWRSFRLLPRSAKSSFFDRAHPGAADLDRGPHRERREYRTYPRALVSRVRGARESSSG